MKHNKKAWEKKIGTKKRGAVSSGLGPYLFSFLKVHLKGT